MTILDSLAATRTSPRATALFLVLALSKGIDHTKGISLERLSQIVPASKQGKTESHHSAITQAARELEMMGLLKRSPITDERKDKNSGRPLFSVFQWDLISKPDTKPIAWYGASQVLTQALKKPLTARDLHVLFHLSYLANEGGVITGLTRRELSEAIGISRNPLVLSIKALVGNGVESWLETDDRPALISVKLGLPVAVAPVKTPEYAMAGAFVNDRSEDKNPGRPDEPSLPTTYIVAEAGELTSLLANTPPTPSKPKRRTPDQVIEEARALTAKLWYPVQVKQIIDLMISRLPAGQTLPVSDRLRYVVQPLLELQESGLYAAPAMKETLDKTIQQLQGNGGPRNARYLVTHPTNGKRGYIETVLAEKNQTYSGKKSVVTNADLAKTETADDLQAKVEAILKECALLNDRGDNENAKLLFKSELEPIQDLIATRIFKGKSNLSARSLQEAFKQGADYFVGIEPLSFYSEDYMPNTRWGAVARQEFEAFFGRAFPAVA